MSDQRRCVACGHPKQHGAACDQQFVSQLECIREVRHSIVRLATWAVYEHAFASRERRSRSDDVHPIGRCDARRVCRSICLTEVDHLAEQATGQSFLLSPTPRPPLELSAVAPDLRGGHLLSLGAARWPFAAAHNDSGRTLCIARASESRAVAPGLRTRSTDRRSHLQAGEVTQAPPRPSHGSRTPTREDEKVRAHRCSLRVRAACGSCSGSKRELLPSHRRAHGPDE